MTAPTLAAQTLRDYLAYLRTGINQPEPKDISEAMRAGIVLLNLDKTLKPDAATLQHHLNWRLGICDHREERHVVHSAVWAAIHTLENQ